MIRQATRRDIPSIVWCNLTAKTDEEVKGYGLPSSQRTFADQERLISAWGNDSEVKDELVYVYEENEEVVAYVLIGVQQDAIELDNIDAARDFQGKGIGKALVRFVEDQAKQLGKRYVTLGTSRNTKTGRPWRSFTFWLRMGYSNDGEIQTGEGRENGFAEIRFRKLISSQHLRIGRESPCTVCWCVGFRDGLKCEGLAVRTHKEINS